MIVPVTDKALLRSRLRRAHRGPAPYTDFLVSAVVADLVARLAGVQRHFPVAVAMGGQTDELAQALRDSGKTDVVLRLDGVPQALRASAFPGAVADEEALPLAPESVDLIASVLALQWSNDLPGALIQARQALRPDGLFLAAIAAGATLSELREALVVAETELTGGASPRVLPTADVRDLGGLLQRAGFALPVADRDVLTVRYPSAFELFADLRAMGGDERAGATRAHSAAAAAVPQGGGDLCRALRRSRRTGAGDVRDRLAVRLGAAREPAEAGAARLSQREPVGRAEAALGAQSVATMSALRRS